VFESFGRVGINNIGGLSTNTQAEFDFSSAGTIEVGTKKMESTNDVDIRERFDSIEWVNSGKNLLPAEKLFDNHRQITDSNVVLFDVL
jgi:hypothetical protein